MGSNGRTGIFDHGPIREFEHAFHEDSPAAQLLSEFVILSPIHLPSGNLISWIDFRKIQNQNDENEQLLKKNSSLVDNLGFEFLVFSRGLSSNEPRGVVTLTN